MQYTSPNMHLFDCRRYIVPGDIIQFDSWKACETVNNVDRYTSIKVEAPVVDVYENFVVVNLKKIRDCVNRWDISKINGRSIGNSGYFGGIYARS